MRCCDHNPSQVLNERSRYTTKALQATSLNLFCSKVIPFKPIHLWGYPESCLSHVLTHHRCDLVYEPSVKGFLTSDFVFQTELLLFRILQSCTYLYFIINMKNCLGDLTDVSAKNKSHFVTHTTAGPFYILHNAFVQDKSPCSHVYMHA